MTQDVKRRRGRPRGSGKPDGSTLQQVAELLAEDLRLRPTTAIKRLIGTKNDSDIRRLQVKWKAEGRTLLSQAQERRERRRAVLRGVTVQILIEQAIQEFLTNHPELFQSSPPQPPVKSPPRKPR